MKTIRLTQGKFALVDDEDYEFLSQWKWRAMKTRGDRWYAVRTETLPTGKRRATLMHKVLCRGKEIDHRDGNGLNNQKENLRSVSHSFNIFNSRQIGKSGVRGVLHHKQESWRAQIRFNKKTHHLGIFTNLDDAKKARRLAELRFFGEAYEPKVK